MFTVICFDMSTFVNEDMEKLVEGDKYTVISEGFLDGVNYYIIKGYEIDRTGCGCGYDKIHFIPCSDIDEMELIEQRQTQLA